MSKLIGKQAEKAAEQYLQAKGLTTIERNYLCKMGEIDLIMLDKDDLVFIEVRHRRSQAYGGAIGSITYAKQQKIWRTAQHFLQYNAQRYDCEYRFDVIAFQGSLEQVCWIKNAFSH
ncbi:YraN family protein [Legionella sp. W05-934-2]|jgi:putative endonuclease|uniref:YraN family protein n=1 Tax=Legionella sp. W05-934-2 TaxID=1198649 RepID=UPI0034623D91